MLCFCNRANRQFLLSYGSKSIPVRYVFYPFMVPPGTWLGFLHPDGYFVVTIGWLFKSSEERVPDAAEVELGELIAMLAGPGGPHRVVLARLDK